MVGNKAPSKYTGVGSYFDVLKKLVLKQSLLGLNTSGGITEKALRIRGVPEFFEESSVHYVIFFFFFPKRCGASTEIAL